MASIILYRIPQVVFLVLSGTGARLMNYPTYRTDFKLFKNVVNEVDVFIKDQDRKAVPLLGKTLMMCIVDRRIDRLILKKELAIVDEFRGLARLTTTPAETANWDTGFLSFTIIFQREDGSEVLLYTDENYGAKSHLEVVDGPIPPPVASKEVLFADFLQASSGYPLLTYNVSTPLAGPAQIGNDAGVQGVAVYVTAYSGKFWFQASLENQPPTLDSEWFDVPIGGIAPYFHFVNATGVQDFNVVGNFMWVRFKTLNDITLAPNGKVSKVLYRN